MVLEAVIMSCSSSGGKRASWKTAEPWLDVEEALEARRTGLGWAEVGSGGKGQPSGLTGSGSVFEPHDLNDMTSVQYPISCGSQRRDE